jgi:hypothetical protein
MGSNNKEHLLRRLALAAKEDPVAEKALAAFNAGQISSAREAARTLLNSPAAILSAMSGRSRLILAMSVGA